ncbi:MAG TPA: peptidoglycan recognition family protein [Bryobacteraceae bacterium]
MGVHESKNAPARLPVEWIARRIGDPVVRLRFLKRAAPALEFSDRAASPRRRPVFSLVFALLAVAGSLALVLRSSATVPPPPPVVRIAPPLAGSTVQSNEIWQVEADPESEVYSNGLRLDRRFLISTHARRYVAFPADGGGGLRRSDPAGIVFHTTESRIVPFEARENSALKKIGSSLLSYVRQKRAYHFLIDRFGRVYRVVAETDAANHAGYSVWADDRWRYINLNESFLGVSFETDTRKGQTEAEITPAQEHAAAMLTEMLRTRYRIPAENCLTHGQVSVNPSNMRAGYHTDWSSGFPFERLGLPDNYTRPLPALWAFGFEADPSYLESGGERIRAGVEGAEAMIQQKAADAGMSVSAYRKSLQKAYRQGLKAASGT